MFKILLIVKIYCLDKSTQVYTLYVDIKFGFGHWRVLYATVRNYTNKKIYW